MADELGLDRGYVLAMIASERAERLKNPEAASTWRELAEKMGIALAVLLAVQFALFTETGSALIRDGIAIAAYDNGLYIIRTGAAWLALVTACVLALMACEAFPDMQRQESPTRRGIDLA